MAAAFRLGGIARVGAVRAAIRQSLGAFALPMLTRRRSRTARSRAVFRGGVLRPATDLVVSFAPPDIGDAEMRAVVEVLQSGWLTTGPAGARRSRRRSPAYTGAAHAVAVNSGTAALHLSLLAAGVGPGREVVTTPLTFCATVNAIIHAGGTPVLADIDLDHAEPRSGGGRGRDHAADRGARCRCTSPAGRRRWRGWARIAARHGLVDRRRRGARASARPPARAASAPPRDLTAFSFHAMKNLTTGEGGMVTTDRADWAERIRVLALHGMSRDAWARYAGARRARSTRSSRRASSTT